jgi:Alr-MurF fusion protein
MHRTGYSPKEIAVIVAGRLAGDSDKAPLLTRLCMDSREINVGIDTLFVAFKGPRDDGHRYIRELYWRGVAAFLVQRVPADWDLADAVFIVVEDTLHALQTLAAHHRSRFNIPVVGITGSNGKTIVKEWLYEVLQPDHAVVRSPKSFNSQVGVPLSVWNMAGEHEIAIFEAGISQPGEMAALGRIIHPTIGVFTNIGPAHDTGFSSSEEKVKEKLLLFSRSKKIIYNTDQPLLQAQLENDERGIGWGEHPAAVYHISDRKILDKQTRLTLNYSGKAHPITLPFFDEASIENAMHVLVASLELGLPLAVTVARIQYLRNIPMRLELKYGRNNCTIIDDTYSADMLSLQVALGFFDRQDTRKERTLILSAFEGSGLSDQAFCEALLPLLKQYRIRQLLGVGNVFFTHRASFEKVVRQFTPFTNTEEIQQFIEQYAPHDELILVKGARQFRFERLVQYLQGQTHRTVLEVNLNALVDNLNVYRSYLKPPTGIIAMVKAFSYGSGSVEIARLMEREKVDYLAVAYPDEGVQLRQLGVQIPIMVLNPDADDWEAMVRHRLEPEIYSIQQLGSLLHFLEAYVPGRNMPVHIKVETGMNRLGFSPGELQEVLTLLVGHQHIIVATVFSHLAASEDPAHDAFSHEQIQMFERAVREMELALHYPVKKHLLNSSGILRFPEAHYDYVRLGIGLYGVDCAGQIQERLLPAGRLKTRISQIRAVPAGASIGYSRKGTATVPSRIAVIAIGYADGFLRQFSNGVGEVFMRGNKAPVIGNVCMDMAMVDVTQIPDAAEGDEVEIYGQHISIIDAAAKAGTIAYELLTHISGRVKRVYYWD